MFQVAPANLLLLSAFLQNKRHTISFFNSTYSLTLLNIYCRFFKNRMESTGTDREINNVGDCRNEYRRTFFEKQSGYRVQIRLFVGRVKQDLVDFRF